MELQSKATATGKSALANLHRLAANQEASAAGAERQSPEARRQAARSEAEFQKTQQELTRLSALVLEQQDALEQLRSQLEAEQKARPALKEQHDDEVMELKEQIKQERDKREKIARTRAQKNEKLLEKFQKQMIDYETEILKLKDNNEVAKLKSMTANAQASTSTAVVPPGAKADKQLTGVQAEVKEREKNMAELQKLRDGKTKHAGEKRDLTAQREAARHQLAEEEKRATKYSKEKDEALNALSQARG